MCLLKERLFEGALSFLQFNVMQSISYQYFFSATQIYDFSHRGILPTEKTIYRHNAILWTQWAIILFLGTIYEILVYCFSQKGNFSAVFTTCTVFEILVASNNVFICVIFILAARRMRLSKAKPSDAGHMSRSVLLINFGLLIAIMVGIFFSFFNDGTYSTYSKVVQTVIYITSWFVELFYVFILIRYELTDFVLRTVVQGNGQVEIVGIDRNENELFKFSIDKELLEKHDKLLGNR